MAENTMANNPLEIMLQPMYMLPLYIKKFKISTSTYIYSIVVGNILCSSVFLYKAFHNNHMRSIKSKLDQCPKFQLYFWKNFNLLYEMLINLLPVALYIPQLLTSFSFFIVSSKTLCIFNKNCFI